jgi:hypothetical protein
MPPMQPARSTCRRWPSCTARLEHLARGISGYATGEHDEGGAMATTTERPAPVPPTENPAATARPPRPRPAGDDRTRSAPPDDVRALVPRTLRISAALGWRLLVVPVAIALLLAACCPQPSAGSTGTTSREAWRPRW